MYDKEILVAQEHIKELRLQAEQYRQVRLANGDHPSLLKRIRLYLGEESSTQHSPVDADLDYNPDPAAA